MAGALPSRPPVATSPATSPWGQAPGAPAMRPPMLPVPGAGPASLAVAGLAGLGGLFGGTTPGRLRGMMLGLTLLAALVGAVSLWAAAGIRDTAKTIGRDAEPSVALALRMASTLADMNAAALADSLTDDGTAGGTSAAFHDGMASLGADVVEAARNITYGEAEAGPLRDLLRWTLAYQEAVAEARTLGAGNAWVTGHRVQWASRVNRDFATPAAEALAQANERQLDLRYAQYRSVSLLLGGAAVAAFVVLMLALVGVQAWLVRQTRRTLNPMLAGATLLAAAAGLWLGGAVLTERADLRTAKEDAYDSLLVLFRAKGAANAMRADMSMWLLDPATRDGSQARIGASTAALVGTDPTTPSFTQVQMRALDMALQREQSGDAKGATAATPRLGGFLGTELSNITFGVPERQAATESVTRLRDALGVIRAVQAREPPPPRPGQTWPISAQIAHTEVQVHWLGTAPDGGSGAFRMLQSALDRTVAINQSEFDRRITSALHTATLLPFVTVGALVLTALLALGGLWQRLREYR